MSLTRGQREKRGGWRGHEGGEVGWGDERQEEMVGTGAGGRCACENVRVRKVSENSRQKLEPNQTRQVEGKRDEGDR